MGTEVQLFSSIFFSVSLEMTDFAYILRVLAPLHCSSSSQVSTGFKVYTRTLHVSATTCMVQPTTIHNGIAYILIGQQDSLQEQTISGTMAYVSTQKNNYLALSHLATFN